MKLTTMTKVTIDGVMQGDGHASDEDRRNGFERGGRARGKGDNETHAFISQTYQRADAFLFGLRPGKPQCLDTTGDDLQMQYLISVIHDQASLATPEEHAAIDVFNDRLQTEGHWVFGGGLASPNTATVIDNRGAEAPVTDGPFLESKEYLAGFWIIEAAGLDVALKLAAEGSKACNRKTEVRPFR